MASMRWTGLRSWSFYNGRISYEEYMKQLDGFTASEFNAEKWADLIEKSGPGMPY